MKAQMQIIACLPIFHDGGSGNRDTENGFRLAGALVSLDEIMQGGPIKDGITAFENHCVIVIA